jgi:biopolymer transport protein ExbD
MAKKKKLKIVIGDTEVPLSAMIDVTFLLLAYFLITSSPVIEEAHVAINTPSILTTPIIEIDHSTFDIHVLKDKYHIPELGRTFENAQDMKNFIADFANNTGGDNNKVNLKLDGSAKTERLVDLIDLLAKEGLEDKMTLAFLN